ncbi:response regulator transcription factor [Salinivibrio sp. IB643]|uniref:response regulator transcription factor n=1 Tax=Salinivibrio sp. IB643 TaxID=1909445 RepID=UPI000988998C|nr:response regulator transcription factor [Salinivibrio sp. IB643]OOE96528.1 DNA-binding response regulator [Salinivibrio sp. IB643]
MAYRVLLVDDEKQIHTFVRISLNAEGFDYLGAYSLESALSVIQHQSPDVIVLDLGLPDGEGISLLNHIREKGHTTPVIILTARDQEEEKITLLEAGANDYISKPFGVKELIVRIKVLVRDLIAPSKKTEDLIQCGELSLSLSSHQFWYHSRLVSLTKKEFHFMKILMEGNGCLVKKDDLLISIWGETHRQDNHYLRVLVSQIRKKICEDASQHNIIKTEPGIGYRLCVNEDDHD